MDPFPPERTLVSDTADVFGGWLLCAVCQASRAAGGKVAIARYMEPETGFPRCCGQAMLLRVAGTRRAVIDPLPDPEDAA